MPDNDEPAYSDDELAGPWSKHDLITAYLRYGILTGEYPPGSNLPSTRVLKERFDAAPQTIREATLKLAEEGLAVTRSGRGIVVRDHRQRTMTPAAYKEPSGPGEAYKWILEAERRGLPPGRSELLEVAEVRPPADVRDALALGNDGTAMLRRQVLHLGDESCELVKNYYPMDLAAGTALTVKKKIRGGAPRLLADMGFPPVRCIDKVSAMQPTPEQYVALRMPSKIPVLRTLRQTLSIDDRVIEVTEMAKAGHLYELRYEF